MAQARRCPKCAGPMARFYAQGVELERCGHCRGVWLDAGELEQVLGQPVALADAAKTELRCAYCRNTLHQARFAKVTVERCEGCRGVYLDEGELERLTFGEPGQASPDAQFLFFYCAACGGRFHPSEGRESGEGVVCKGCAPPAGPPLQAPERLGLFARLLGRRG